MTILRKTVYAAYAIILIVITLAALLGAKEGVILFLIFCWLSFIFLWELAYWIEGE